MYASKRASERVSKRASMYVVSKRASMYVVICVRVYAPYTKKPKNRKGFFKNDTPPIKKNIIFFFGKLLAKRYNTQLLLLSDNFYIFAINF
jgi:hypothetical protein